MWKAGRWSSDWAEAEESLYRTSLAFDGAIYRRINENKQKDKLQPVLEVTTGVQSADLTSCGAGAALRGPVSLCFHWTKWSLVSCRFNCATPPGLHGNLFCPLIYVLQSVLARTHSQKKVFIPKWLLASDQRDPPTKLALLIGRREETSNTANAHTNLCYSVAD